MFQIRHTVILLFIIITLYKINCASIVGEKEISTDVRELEIKEDTVTRNSSLEARSRTKRWIKLEKIKTPSGELFSITSPRVRTAKCGKRAKLIRLFKNGRMSSKEYGMVSSEIEKSKGTGCFTIKKIRKVTNGCLWDMYKSRRDDIRVETNATDTNERLLFYGTDNVWQYTTKGFDERLSTGGSFGQGIYFTDQFSVADSKSINKTCPSCDRKLLLSRVILGKDHKESGRVIHAHAPIGFHSVIGKPFGAAHDDYVVYRGEQVYPEYVISYNTCGSSGSDSLSTRSIYNYRLAPRHSMLARTRRTNKKRKIIL